MPKVRFDDACDKCGEVHWIIRRLDTGGGSAVNLCLWCWNKEMKWRVEQNKFVSSPFDVFDFYSNAHE